MDKTTTVLGKEYQARRDGQRVIFTPVVPDPFVVEYVLDAVRRNVFAETTLGEWPVDHDKEGIYFLVAGARLLRA